MMFRDVISISLRHAIRNKIRTQAAVVAMSLGVAGIIVVFSLGEAVNKAICYDLELVGRAVILRASWNFERLERWHHGKFTSADVSSLERMAGVESVSPCVSKSSVLASHYTSRADCLILGAEANFFTTLDLRISEGRQILDTDVARRGRVCVIGQGTRSELFERGRSPLGRSIMIEGTTWEVVGVLGGIEYQDFHQCIIVPLSTAQARIDMAEIRNIYVRAHNWDDAAAVQGKALEALRNNHRGYEDAIELEYFPERIQTLRSAVFVVHVLLWAALAVVLALAGLGILGIMLISVQERKLEIGLRRAFGASRKAILSQFLAEAIAVCGVGAVQGLVLGSVAVVVLKLILNVEPEFDRFVLACFIGLGIGIVIGIAAGLVPAWKASHLEVIEAMRFE